MAFTDSTVQYYGRGEAYLGDAVAGGMPSNFDKYLPQIESLEIALNAEYVEFISNRATIAKKVLKVVHTIMATGKLVCAVHSATILKTYLYASQTTIAGGAVSATAFAKTALPTVGDILPLPSNKVKATSVVITDSAGSPVTGTLGTDYELDADAIARGASKRAHLLDLLATCRAEGRWPGYAPQTIGLPRWAA